MRSSLARHVRRQIPAVQLHAPFCAPLSLCRPETPRLLLGHIQTRTFLGKLLGLETRHLKQPEYDPGFVTMILFRKAELKKHRPPQRKFLFKAFVDFFKAKRMAPGKQGGLNTTQALVAWRVLLHLSQTPGPEQLSVQHLRTAQLVVKRSEPGDSEDHRKLSETLYDVLRSRVLGAPREDGHEVLGEEVTQPLAFRDFVAAQARYGGALEAAARVQAHWALLLQDKANPYPDAHRLWIVVLEGLAREDKEGDLLHFLDLAKEQAGIPDTDPSVRHIMTTFYAARNRVAETKEWFNKPIPSNAQFLPNPWTYAEMIPFALRNGEQEWLEAIFENLAAREPLKEHRDVMLQWEATSKSPEEIIAMATDVPGFTPDVNTLNTLIQAAMQKKDAYLAERYIATFQDLGIKQNATSYLLQMSCRLDAGDVSGAIAIYQRIASDEISVADNEHVPVVNKFIRVLCAKPQPNVDGILEVVATLEEQQATLEPETAASLCVLLLKTEQLYDVVDTLSLHTLKYSVEERARVCRALVEYCLDTDTSMARAWEAYELARQFFPDMPRDDRTQLMEAFFKRKRPDMATLVFGHMRALESAEKRPTVETYLVCLEGLARTGSEEHAKSLQMVHNMLKMDTTIKTETKLYNALMLAYVGCENADRAFEFWDEIAASTEGPTQNSLAIVFRVCEAHPFGERRARPIWDKIQRLELDVPPEVACSFAAFLAARGPLAEVMYFLVGMDARVGYPPNTMTLGVVYNAIRWHRQQDMFEAWAQQEFPELWARLLNKGRRITLGGVQKFRIGQELKP